MIIAVVATGAGAAGRDRLLAQLAALPDRARGRVSHVDPAAPDVVLAELGRLAQRAAENGEGIAVVPDDLVVSDRLVLDLLDDPRPANRLLVTAGPGDVRCAGATVTAAGSTQHRLDDATHTGLGLLAVADAGAAATAWTAAAQTVQDRGWHELDPTQAATVALVRAGVTLTAVAVGPYVAGRDAALLPAVESLDEDDLAWRRASRGGDGVWSTFVLRPISRRVSRRAVRAGFTPNQVTVIGFVLGLLAAVLIALGATTAVVAGALLLQVALVLDCVDGEIARSTRRFSAFGAWLDLVTDRVKENAVLAAIAIADHRLWPLAVAGIGLQLTRHMADYAFPDTVLAYWRRPRPDTRPFADTTAPPAATGTGDRLGTPTGHGLVHWVKQGIHMQIGERWLVLSAGLLIGTLAGGGAVALVAYLVTVGIGLAWVLVGWTLRTLSNPRRREPLPPEVARVLTTLRDSSPGMDHVFRSPLTWPLAMTATVLEMVELLAQSMDFDRDQQLPWAFLWAFAVAYHRYDIFYRARGGRSPVPRWVNYAGGGWFLRVIALLLLGNHGQLDWFLPVGAIWLLLVYVPESLFRAKPRTFPRSVGVAKKQLRRSVAVPVERLLMRVTTPQRMALVGGLPDGEENSLVTAARLAQRYPGEVVLVANDPVQARILLDRTAARLGLDAARVRIVAKKDCFRIFLRAEVVFYTHGLYDSPRPVGRRLHVNLWHGTGPKWNANANFGQHIGAQAHSASSPLWGHEAIRALSMSADTRIVAGNPRQDVVAAVAGRADRSRLIDLGLDPVKPLVVWLPTFRSSAVAGHVGLSEGEPLTEVAGRAFAAAAGQHDVQLVAKPHRLDSALFETLGVTVVTDEQLLAAGVSLYELLGLADGLLSDYSSGWVDLLDQPTSIGLYVPDLDTYRQARGLNRPDLGLAAAGLSIDEQNADGFFADVAAGRTWRAEARARCVERIELIDVPPGHRTEHMLDELGAYATELFGDDLGLRQRRPATSS